MTRRIIRIDEEKCDGCGMCADACHEGAIIVEDGKAKLAREDYCDGLGDCLPVCPVGAISFEERETAEYGAETVKERLAQMAATETPANGCPGSAERLIERERHEVSVISAASRSELGNWPVQLKLVPEKAPCFDGANLLVAADCCAYARAGFHVEFMKGRAVIIGCPKLDGVDYSGKLERILVLNDIRSVTIVRMEVPCCRGIENAVTDAVGRSQKTIQLRSVVVSVEGELLESL
jgi:ferredoxin